MGDLHLIKGGGGVPPQTGTVEAVLKSASEQLTSENTEVVIVIALHKPYPQQLHGRFFWSACDSLHLMGILHWALSKIHTMIG